MTELELDKSLARKTTRATFVTRLFVVVACIFMVGSVALSLFIAGQTNKVVDKVSDKQNSNTPVIERLEQLATDINSCTNPEGDCAKRGQQSQIDAINLLNQYAIYLEACADAPGQQTEKELRGCADALVERSKQ